MKYNNFVSKNNNTQLFGIVLSVDNREWYYGRPENSMLPNKKVLITHIISPKDVISYQYADEINRYFLWIQSHEKDTSKRKKRSFYVDIGFFVDKNN